MADLKQLPGKLRHLRRELRDEYLQPHDLPWIIGFSAGKDSTLVAQLVTEMVLSIAPDERRRRIFIISNDTLVESPVFQSFVVQTLDRMAEGIATLNIPVEIVKTHPEEGETFWVNLLGKGYPAPNRNFRWCTDRMKIRPTTQFIREQVCAAGQVILLLGVRRAESAHRNNTIQKHSLHQNGSRLSPHSDLQGCMVYRPIENILTEEVWHILLNNPAPWGGDHREMITLYRNAQGGECPFIVGSDDAPSCGTNSARFGCWTCTVVEKDNSLDALIDAGFEHLEPLSSFRERLKAVSADPECRSKVRRNGQPGLGPLTYEARKMLLGELLEIERKANLPLISSQEVRLIQEWWARDESNAVQRDADRMAQYIQLSVGSKNI